MTTLKDALEAIKSIKITVQKKANLADELLGRYKGITPKDKTSTQFIREMRDNLYGKI